ncbi:MAG TPA: universal stress protein [Longilinea sp.]|nr:universal stress protein [Longilinea sp.]
MFKHILVPLDGSGLAEAAIPPAVALSAKLGSHVTLLHVIEKNAPQEIHGQKHLTTEDDARQYLKIIAGQNFGAQINISTHVHTEEVSQVARSIVEHSQELKPDLIILCAHGEGGLHDLVMGSIPQQVISAGSVPVMLLQPDARTSYQNVRFERCLVALDGEEDHDYSLVVASELARAIGAELDLVRIVPTLSTLSAEDAATGTLLPAATNAMLEIAEDEACEYLQEKLNHLTAQQITATAEVERGDPAVEVVKLAELKKADLIILGTHGKKGMSALWAGSVAPRIVSRTHLPILLVPVTG